MRVSVIGTGYVGLVAAAGFAVHGHEVLCTDLDKEKIAALQQGQIPIYEPGLQVIVQQNLDEGRLRFSTDNAEAARHAELIVLAVGTPTGDEEGAPNLRALYAAAQQVGAHLDEFTVIVNKSTVPVGTAEKVKELIAELTSQDFAVVSNPEFLKEGSAVKDFMSPDLVIVGVDDERARGAMDRLYRPFFRKDNRVIYMGVRSAEITKYVANAYLATRISFINDIARLCDLIGADVEEVRAAMGSDPRIGDRFLYPGCGYGGSCMWGLSFKPNTDDIREAPALTSARGLLETGVKIRAHDPIAARNFETVLDRPGAAIEFVDRAYEAAEGADLLVLCTEWGLYRSPDFKRIKAAMSGTRVFDGRNQWDSEEAELAGLRYWGVGR